MREIKFRAWRIEEREWVYAEPVYGFFPSLHMDEENGDNLAERYGDIQEYTGLKDKNGKEIYEGDILNVGNNAVVGFERGAFQPRYDRGTAEDMEDPLYLIARDAQVLGNIYENPDLLSKDSV